MTGRAPHLSEVISLALLRAQKQQPLLWGQQGLEYDAHIRYGASRGTALILNCLERPPHHAGLFPCRHFRGTFLRPPSHGSLPLSTTNTTTTVCFLYSISHGRKWIIGVCAFSVSHHRRTGQRGQGLGLSLPTTPRNLEHSLAYRALDSYQLDDCYAVFERNDDVYMLKQKSVRLPVK